MADPARLEFHSTALRLAVPTGKVCPLVATVNGILGITLPLVIKSFGCALVKTVSQSNRASWETVGDQWLSGRHPTGGMPMLYTRAEGRAALAADARALIEEALRTR